MAHTTTVSMPYQPMLRKERNILRKFTDEGKDLLVYLPYMKTILGHESFAETSYYLKLTANRFPYITLFLKK